MVFFVNTGAASIIRTGADKGTGLDADRTRTDRYNKKLCITKFTHGSINWNTGKVRASGRACPTDKKVPESSDYILSAAKADASHNLRKILKKIGFAAIKSRYGNKIFHKNNSRINNKSSDKIPDYTSLHDTIMAGIETIAADAKIVEQHYTSDRAMEVTVETPIYGGFLQLVLPDSIQEIPKINFIVSSGKNTDKKTTQDKPEKNIYTGLIIDVRGLGFHPVIYPVVASEQGEEIYSSVFISREYAVQRGVCGYACTMEEALKSKRTGKNPIIIKGLRKGGVHNSKIVISRSDAETIERATEHYSFMKQCRVVIVPD